VVTCDISARDAHIPPRSSATPFLVWWCGDPAACSSTASTASDGAAATSAAAASPLGLEIGALATQRLRSSAGRMEGTSGPRAVPCACERGVGLGWGVDR